MLRYMLDTNIVIYAMKNKPAQVREKLNTVATGLCVSSITVSELYYGAYNSKYPDENIKVFENFLSRLQVLDYDTKASVQYGQIKAELRKTGNLIGENDLHISAHARSQGLILVTNNTREFERVPHLQLENWVA